MALADTANLIVQLRLDDKFSGPMGRAQGLLGRFGSGLGQTGKGVGQLAAGLGRVGVVAGTVAAGGFIAVAKAAGNFEAQLNTINTIIKVSDTQLKGIGEGIRETFRQTGEPLEDLTAGYYDLLSAGIKVKDAQATLNTAVQLGIGGLGTTQDAVNLLATTMNTYGLDASGAAKASDIFAAAVRDGVVHVDQLAAGIGDVAPLAAQTGVKIEELGAAYAVLTARGIPAAEVGTQVNRAILELIKPGPELVKILKGLGEESFEASIKQKGLVATLQDVRDEAEKQGVPFQDLFGRIEAYKFALATTGPAHAKFIKELRAMHLAAGETTAQFEERAQGLNFQLGRLKALAQDAGITIGNALLPKIVPLMQKLNEFITNNQGKIKQFGKDLAGAFSDFAAKIQDTDFSGLIEGLKIVASVGGKVVDIFLKLPPGIQAAIVGGAAINRISGGLVGAGVGNIAGGAIKLAFGKFFERGSPTNPLFVVPVGGGLGGGAPAVAGKAGGGLVGGVAKFVLGPLAAVAIGSEIAAVINERKIAPARAFEERAFKAVLDSKDVSRIVGGLEAIERGQNDPRLLQQTALIASNIPFIGDALGHVGPKLEEQKQVLLQQLQEMGLTRHQAEALVARANATQSKVEQGNQYALTLNGIVRASHATQRQIAARTAAQRLATERGFAKAHAIERDIAGTSRITSRKDFSPSFNASINTTVNAQLSTYTALQTINRVDNIRYNGKQIPINV